MPDIQQADILNMVANLQLSLGHRGASCDQIVVSLLPPPAERALRRHLRERVVRLVPEFLAEDRSQYRTYTLTRKGWLQSNRRQQTLKIIDAFLRALRAHVQQGTRNAITWTELVSAGLSDSDFNLACITAHCFELSERSYFNALAEGVVPIAEFTPPIDVGELLDIEAAVDLAEYRDAVPYSRRLTRIRINEEATGDKRQAANLVFEHMARRGTWPLTRSLNAQLRAMGIDLAQVAGRFIVGQDIYTSGAQTKLTLLGLLVAELADDERRDVLVLLQRIGRYVLRHPEARVIEASEIADGVEIDEDFLMSCLPFIQSERWLYVSTGNPPTIENSQFNLGPHLSDHADAREFIDLVIDIEQEVHREQFRTLQEWSNSYASRESDVPDSSPQLFDAKTISKDYQLKNWIGEGTAAEVWKAEDVRLGRAVAVKFIRDSATSRAALEHARALSRVAHASIVTVYDIVCLIHPTTGLPCDAVIMEFLEGPSLTSRIGQDLDVAEARSIGLAILDALQAYHSAGLAHLDLYEDNVIVVGAAAKVIDPIYHDTAAFASTATRTSQQARDVRQAKDILLQLLARALPSAVVDQFQRATPLQSSLLTIREAFLAMCK